MDEYSPDAFVNRDDPIPIVRLDPSLESSEEGSVGGDKGQDTPKESRTRRFRDYIPHLHSRSNSENNGSISSYQDRLLEKLLAQVIPSEDMSYEPSPSSSFVERPNFNITTMSNNFRRFNARVGVLFVFQARVIKLLSWKKTTETLSFLAVYTFVCLDPYLITVLPLAIAVLAIFTPAFVVRHPAAPQGSSSEAHAYSTAGPPLAPAPTVRPAKELSKDFFRNMRDLQNSMEDFSRVHDQIVAFVTPRTNFSNESLSSALFIFLFLGAAFMSIAANLLPWRFIFLAGGWTVVMLGHPQIQSQMVATHDEHLAPREQQAKSWLETLIAHDIVLDSPAEVQEVEIFELQRLSAGEEEWESWLFSPSPYDPMSEARIRGDRPRGTRFFEDVQPPRGWEWSEKKWALDLQSRVWVEERIITGVEIETEGERWVYDLEYERKDRIGVVELPASASSPSSRAGSLRKGKGKSKPMPSWEESEVDNSGRRGLWRRRRWTRLVKRRNLNSPEADS